MVWRRKASSSADTAAATRDYRAFVEAQVAQERTLKASIEAKAITVITTATSLATLAFAVSAAGTALKTLSLSFWSVGLIVGGVLVLLSSAAIALGLNAPSDYQEAQPTQMKDLMKRYKRWTSAELDSARQVTLIQIDIWRGAELQNERKAGRLGLAIGLEILGVALLFSAAIVILISSAVTPGSTVTPSASPSHTP